MYWLASVGTINLIDVLTYYLILTLVVGTAVRLRNYLAIGGFIYRFPNRWPKLLGLVKHHKAIFLRWPTLLPIGLTLVLTLVNALASRLVWSHAKVSSEDLGERWAALLAVVVSGGLMGFLDFRAMFFFGRFDRTALEADLDRAEHWLQTWKAPAVRILTFGFIHPRKLVNEQVQKALIDANLAVNGQLWRWSLQIGMRIAFGLALWSTWAVAAHEAARSVGETAAAFYLALLLF